MSVPVVAPAWRSTPPLLPLHYPDLWTKLTARPFTYSDVISLRNKGVGWLDFCNRLTSTRGAALDVAGQDAEAAVAVKRIEEYLGFLGYLLEHLDRFIPEDARSRITYRWVSVMVPGNLLGPWIITLCRDPALDQAMMVLRLAVALWQQAHESGCKVAGGDSEAPSMAALTAGVELARRAAGAFDLLSQTLWPALAERLSPPKQQAPEVQPWFAAACSHLCLGYAQMLVAYRSYCKGSSFGVTAQLYVAASDLCERAAELCRNAAADGFRPVSDRFMRFTALSSSLAAARARLCQARQLLESKEAARACVQAKHASQELRLCAYVADNDESWLQTFRLADEDVAATCEQCERERTFVYLQSESSAAPEPLPSGRCLVTPVPYVLPKLALDVDDDA